MEISRRDPRAKRSTRHRLLGLATVLIAALIAAASARTVVLVFDDSNSMAGERVAFANYATQNLIALLAPEDRLEIVRMSAPSSVGPVGSDKRSGVATVQGWDVVGSTPYTSVTTGMTRLRSLLAQGADPEEDYWLVIFGDGTFDEFVDANDDYLEEVAVNRIRSDLSALRNDFSDRRLGVVFLGIGDQAPLLARAWQGAGAITDTAITPPDIVGAMFEIAALITGRDPSQTDAQQLPVRPGATPGTVEVESRFPLRRLTAFYQGNSRANLSVAAGSTLTTAAGETVALSNDGPYPTARGGLYGSVNLVTAQNPDRGLDAGSYTLNLSSDVPVGLDSIRFLPEVALELEVVRSPADTPLCSGDPMTVTVRLREPRSGRAFDLGVLPQLAVDGGLSGVGVQQPLAFAPRGADGYAAITTVPAGPSTLSVSARYPGYFNLRSRLLTVEGVPCSGDTRARLDPASLAVTTTFSAAPIPAGVSALTVDSSDPSLLPATMDVVVEAIPDGVTVEIAGRSGSGANARFDGVPLVAGRPLEVGVLLDSRYTGSGPQQLTLRLEAAAPRFRWSAGGDRASLSLIPGDRDLALIPQSEPWSAPLNRLEEGGPFRLEALVNGEPVPAAELSDWRVGATDAPGRLGLDLGIDPASGEVELRPEAWCPLRYWCVLGLTPSGVVEVEVEATTPRGESARARARFEIESIGWWRAWGLPLLQLLLFAFLVWYLIGQIVRPRFRRGSALVREEKVRRSLISIDTVASHTRDIRSHRGLWTRLRPYAPERAVVWGFRLEATRGQSLNLLAPFPQDLRLNRGRLADGPRDRKRVRITPGSVLSREPRAKRIEEFTYKLGRR